MGSGATIEITNFGWSGGALILVAPWRYENKNMEGKKEKSLLIKFAEWSLNNFSAGLRFVHVSCCFSHHDIDISIFWSRKS